jgi:hypothetical protein
MKWREITDRRHALAAIAEFDQLGRAAFLFKYGFGQSTHLFVRHEGKQYDIKALAGAMHGFADPAAGPLKSDVFSSGKVLVELFRRLGFEVIESADTNAIEQATTLSAAFEALLAGYIQAKDTKISKLSPMWRALQRAHDALEELTAEYPHIEVKSSVGKGNWAEVPWIALLDDRITDTTTSGVYVVYLFRADMTGAYATFNQGVTAPKKELGWPAAQRQLAEKASALRGRYAERLKPSFTCADGVDLRSKKGGLGAEYEASTIAWRLYQPGAIPTAAALLSDLYLLLDVYDDYAVAPQESAMHAHSNDATTTLSTAALTAALRTRGYHFEPWQVASFVHGVRTKPFMILAGISGTGKSKLPLLIGELTGARVELIPVRPDWTDSADLIGYTSLQGAFVPGRLLAFAKLASENPNQQHFAVLDEMNLARVEQYFAEVLSLIEDRRPTEAGFASHAALTPTADALWRDVHLPSNFAVIGTVNMDETTHGFSRKVLDRAFTLEMSEVDLSSWRSTTAETSLEMSPWPAERWRAIALRPGDLRSPSDADTRCIEEVITVLTKVNEILSIAQLQVGYRVRDEVAMFLLHANADLKSFTNRGAAVNPLDLALLMKVLPRIQGGSGAIRTVLKHMIVWASSEKADAGDEGVRATVSDWASEGRPAALAAARFPRTAARLCLMWERLQADGFTSYWL